MMMLKDDDMMFCRSSSVAFSGSGSSGIYITGIVLYSLASHSLYFGQYIQLEHSFLYFDEHDYDMIIMVLFVTLVMEWESSSALGLVGLE